MELTEHELMKKLDITIRLNNEEIGLLIEVLNMSAYEFYKEDKIYEDQLKIFANRIIYTKNLAEYQQNDPIFTQQNEINSIRLEKQKLIREIEVLKNG